MLKKHLSAMDLDVFSLTNSLLRDKLLDGHSMIALELQDFSEVRVYQVGPVAPHGLLQVLAHFLLVKRGVDSRYGRDALPPVSLLHSYVDDVRVNISSRCLVIHTENAILLRAAVFQPHLVRWRCTRQLECPQILPPLRFFFIPVAVSMPFATLALKQVYYERCCVMLNDYRCCDEGNSSSHHR